MQETAWHFIEAFRIIKINIRKVKFFERSTFKNTSGHSFTIKFLIKVNTLNRKLFNLMIKSDSLNQFFEFLTILKRNFNQAKTFNNIGRLTKLNKSGNPLFKNTTIFKPEISDASILGLLNSKKDIFHLNMVHNFDF